MTAITTIKPSVGRKVWFYDSQGLGNIHDPKTPFDATVVYVHDAGHVNLRVADHSGTTFTRASVELRNPAEDDSHGKGNADFATWMPFQVKTAQKEAA